MYSSGPLRRDACTTPEGFVAWLRHEGAAHDLVSYVESHALDGRGFWQRCPRGDWLLAVALRSGAVASEVADAVVQVAGLAREHLRLDAEVAMAALTQLEKDAKSFDEEAYEVLARHADAAADRAKQAKEEDPADTHAWHAILLAARAHRSPSDAPEVVVHLVQAAVHDAGDCALEAAVTYVYRASAERVRACLRDPFAAPG